MRNIDKKQIRGDIARRKAMPDFGISPDTNISRLKTIQETQRSFNLEVVETLLDELDGVNSTLFAAQQRIFELEARTLSVKLPDPSSKAFWGGSGKNETFYPSTYKIWVKESIERAGAIAQVAVKVV
ncbi:hypothetical protein HV353_21980 (plasmid) [Enterobacter roggenkampii]|uniref:hypothetical protein n=1 Tax=Enterobacter roggenkampii TaxID=1812935 RepID=UPI0015F8C9B5|nr:hypothetical protein [Enterobacter roggenkampii]MBA7745221.1 hypothetical protein [Enterobacter roggenkampii]